MDKIKSITHVKDLIKREEYEDALCLLKQLLDDNSKVSTYCFLLGIVRLFQEEIDNAQEVWLSVFLEADPQNIHTLSQELIEILRENFERSIQSRQLGYAKVIYESFKILFPDYEIRDLQKQLTREIFAFGSALSFEEKYIEAIKIYELALEVDEQYGLIWHAIASNFYLLNRIDCAHKNIKRAIKYDPSYHENFQLLGAIMESKGKDRIACNSFKRAINLEPNYVAPYTSLLKASVRKNDKSLEHELYQLLDNKNVSEATFAKIIENFMHLNCHQQATNTARIALNHFPKSIVIKRFNQVILPIIYANEKEITFYRNRFISLLSNIIKETPIETKEDAISASQLIPLITNFHLGYQGKNDKEIQCLYASFIHKILTKLYPEFSQVRRFDAIILKNRKIRIGFISSTLYSLGLFYINWIKYLNKKKYEIIAYDLSELNGKITDRQSTLAKEFDLHCDRIVHISKKPDLQDICRLLSSENIDVLIMPDIGLHPVSVALSCLKFAPIQCTTWAHPITSGSLCIDYFLSSKLMEIESADEHYSEKLVRLPNLGFSLPIVNVPTLDIQRADYDLRDDWVIYLCDQSLFKYLPQYDCIFPEIAREDSRFHFVFLDPYHGKNVTEHFKQRLKSSFLLHQLDCDERCIFLRRTEESRFLMLNQLCDVFLDSFEWSGGLTTRHAIACGLPVVTCPGELMRSRHSYAMLQMLNIRETIAKSPREFVDIAVRLGKDKNWRTEIKCKVLKNRHLMFEDYKCVQGFESFIDDAVTTFNKSLIEHD